MSISPIERAIAHNESIDHYITVTLRDHFGGDRVSFSQWIEAQQMIRSQNFWQKACEILRDLRGAGVCCTIDGTNNKIHAPANGIYAYR